MLCEKIIASGIFALMLVTSANAGSATGKNKPVTPKQETSNPPAPKAPAESKPLALSLSSSNVLSIAVGFSSTIKVSADGAQGEMSYTLVRPPLELGAMLDSSSGVLIVKPSEAGTYEATVRGKDTATGRNAEIKILISASEVTAQVGVPKLSLN
jgi:hypothetical protein